MDENQKAEHLTRRAWNEQAIKKLGLRLEKDNTQTIELKVWQGDFMLYSEYTLHRGDAVVYQMHVNLERFLKSYIEHFEKFPPISERLKLFPRAWTEI